MKTLQELYTEVMNNDALKAEFLALTTPEQIVAFAAKNGCTATMDEIKSFLEEKSAASGELSDEELAQVAGGKGFNTKECVLSILTAGIFCVVMVDESLKGRGVGTAIAGNAMLCQGNVTSIK